VTAPKPEPLPATAGTRTWVALALVLVCTVVAFRPAFNAGLLSWDDVAYITQNKLLRDAAGLREMWNPSSTYLPQYYPLVFTSYWIEYQFWGANPLGYHTTNVALHLLNILLLFALLQKLGASPWVAVGAVAIFAVHPMQVASVTWVAERKNMLSLAFYLGAFLLYVRHRETGNWRLYAACLCAFVATLLSKTQLLTLPVSLLAAEWLLARERRWRRADVVAVAARAAPMLILGLVFVQVTMLFEYRTTPSHRLPVAADRFFAAGAAPWFYAAKFLFPVNISPVYSKWNVSATDPHWWLAVLSWPVVLLAAWRWRHRLPALAQWGVAHFLIALAPVLGVASFGFLQYSYVADHFFYPACFGGALALMVGADRLAGAAAWSNRRYAVTAAAIVLIAAAGVQTYREASHWRTTETFWLHIVERNPGVFPAHFSLGNYYRGRKDWDRALGYYRQALEIRPDSPGAFSLYIVALRRTQGPQAAIEACDERLAKEPDFYLAYIERAHSYRRMGNTEAALADYDHVLRNEPKGSPLWNIARKERARMDRRSR
jgi:tetratricopeptide (TPR) repeat protein